MSRSVKWLIRGFKGRVPCDFTWSIISARSVVYISACEAGVGNTERRPTPPGQDFYNHLGDASIWVSNISPYRNDFRGDIGGVRFYVHIDHDSPLDVAITISVDDDLPLEIQGYRI